jgi:hypothetical protein
MSTWANHLSDTMSWVEYAKIIWRWHALVPQIGKDYQYHRQFSGLETPMLLRFAEQLKLLWGNRITAANYYSMGLHDPGMPKHLKREYVGTYESWRLFCAFNPMEHQNLTIKKMDFNVHAAGANLPTAEVLAIVSRQPSGCGVPNLGTEEELGAWMDQNAIADVVLKPVDGTHGWGVLSLGEKVGEGRWKNLPQGDAIDLPAIWAHCARYFYRGGAIIQKRLAPHPALAKLMPDVLHTVRVITYLDPEPIIIDAILRIGNSKSAADNIVQGGIAVPLDLGTGRCEQGTMVVNGLPQHMDDHPVTGNRITGFVVPDWEEVGRLAKAGAQRFSMLKCIGWDVGLTTRGPVLLEGNSSCDLTLNQIARRKGILTTRWIEAFNKERAHRHFGLGFSNRSTI